LDGWGFPASEFSTKSYQAAASLPLERQTGNGPGAIALHWTTPVAHVRYDVHGSLAMSQAQVGIFYTTTSYLHGLKTGLFYRIPSNCGSATVDADPDDVFLTYYNQSKILPPDTHAYCMASLQSYQTTFFFFAAQLAWFTQINLQSTIKGGHSDDRRLA